MIKSFACKDAGRLFNDERVKRFQQCEREAREKLISIHIATVVDELRIPPGNRLEKLSGKRKGQYSIRINKQWRICFNWKKGDAYDVEIVDYH